MAVFNIVSRNSKCDSLRRKNHICCLALMIPSLLGVSTFYVFPFIYSFYYAMLGNMSTKEFVGFNNFIETLNNPIFQQACLNNLVFIGIAVPTTVIVALMMALFISKLKHARTYIIMILLIPLVMPSGSTVFFWKVIFGDNGLVMRFLLRVGWSHEEALQLPLDMIELAYIYIWKNISYFIVLFWSGLNWIPKVYYDQMEIEGATAWAKFRLVTVVYLSPTSFVVLLMAVVNSFKVFKEIYLLYGAYPDSNIYLLQHYLNNQMTAMNFPRLSSGAYIIFLLLAFFLLALFKIQKSITDTY